MTILFRCNAGPVIGYGHLTRCRALAQALRRQGETCVMVGPDAADARPEDQNIFSDWISVPDWPSAAEDAAVLVGLSRRLDAGWAVLDDYRVDETYQLTLRAAGLRWLQFDGTATKPIWADLLLVPNLALSERDYVSVLRNPETKILCGPNYALLRPEFQLAQLRPSNRPVEQILVSFGGGDDRGAVEFVLSSLLPKTQSNLSFTVLSGAQNPRNPRISEWTKQHGAGRVRLVVNPDDVASVFASCDLAIMAGGTSTVEAACCGLPMILLSIANNQTKNAQAWEHLGAAVYLGAFPGVATDVFTKTVLAILDDNQRRVDLAQAGRSKVDGQGAQRIVEVRLTL